MRLKKDICTNIIKETGIPAKEKNGFKVKGGIGFKIQEKTIVNILIKGENKSKIEGITRDLVVTEIDIDATQIDIG